MKKRVKSSPLGGPVKVDKQKECVLTDRIHFALGNKWGAIAEPHFHEDDYQIEVLLEGTSKNLNVSRSETMLPWQVNFFNPADPHRVDYRNTDSYFFFVHRKTMSEILEEVGCKISDPYLPSHKAHDLTLPFQLMKR